MCIDYCALPYNVLRTGENETGLPQEAWEQRKNRKFFFQEIQDT